VLDPEKVVCFTLSTFSSFVFDWIDFYNVTEFPLSDQLHDLAEEGLSGTLGFYAIILKLW